MLKYRPLPLIVRIAEAADKDPAAAEALRNEAARGLLTSENFQLVLFVLRDIESCALSSLMDGAKERSADYYVGMLEMVNKFRKALGSLLPEPEPVWQDEMVEDTHPGEL